MRRSIPVLAALCAAAGLALPAQAVAATRAAQPTQPAQPGQSHRSGQSALPAARPHTPKATARSAGVTPAGGGYAGWSLKQHAQAPVSGDHRSALPLQPLQKPSGVLGIDVSSYQGTVNWASYKSSGHHFGYVKATEGTYYRSDTFSSQFNGAKKAGMLRGAYHFANPEWSGGAGQADYFVDHGGAWTKDGVTLPGMVDLETSPYGSMCYGLSASKMVSWIKAFTNEYRKRTGRDAVIYTTTNWWKTCTGNSTAFNQTNPLWIARWASTPGALPGGWAYDTFWQYSATTIDKDRFNGTLARLKVLAKG